jgi:L-fucose mutarotase
MLIGLSPLLSPDLLHALASMGHGDEIVLADANFPSATHAKRLIRLPGSSATAVLDAVLSVLALDTFVPHAALTMQVVDDAAAMPPIVGEFNEILKAHHHPDSTSLERFSFYERAAQAFAVVATGESRIYGNILLKKGVIAV